MKLPTHAPRPLVVSTTPLANLALLLMLCVGVAAMFSTVRGIGLRFAGAAAAVAPGSVAPGSVASGSVAPAPTVIVAVGADGLARLDGAIVPAGGLARAVSSRLERDPAATVMLVVDPSATYQAAIDAAGPLLEEGVLGGRPLSIPTRRQVEALRTASVTAVAGALP